jgi:hypothetical protein
MLLRGPGMCCPASLAVPVDARIRVFALESLPGLLTLALNPPPGGLQEGAWV